jgi:hypothetical protein
MQQAAGQMSAAATQAQKDAAISTANPNPPRHAVLLKMIEGLGIGLSSAATAMATKGREGGAPEVAQYYAGQQQQQIQAQQARIQARDAKVRQDLTTFDTAHALYQTYQNLATVPDEITKSHLDVEAAQQAGQLRAIEATKAQADFRQQYGLSTDQFNSLMGGGAVDPQAAKNLNTYATQKINAAAQILGADYPTVQQAQQILADPKSTPAQQFDAVASVNRALALKGQVTETQIKSGEAAKTAPFGQAKADSLNAAMQSRWNVLNSGKPMPDAYKLNAASTPSDFDRVDKILQQTEQASATKAQQGIIDGIREQMLQFQTGTAPLAGDQTKTGADYLATLPANVRSTVQAIGEGRMPPPPAGSRSARSQQILGELTQAYPGFDATQFPAYQKTRTEFTSGKTAAAINSYNTAIAHLGTMFDHVSGTNSAQINNPVSEVHRQLDLDKQLVSTELAKAVSNGQLTEGEKNSILSSISGATVDSYQTRIREAVQLLNGKLGAFQNQWNNGMPSGFKPTIPIISPESQATLQRIGAKPLGALNFAAPKGAVGTAPASDGKWYYHDAQGNNLGLAPTPAGK